MQPLLVGQVILPRDVTGVVAADQHLPLLHRHRPPAARWPALLPGPAGLAGAAERERARIARVGQHPDDGPVAGRGPHHAPTCPAPRQLQPVGEQGQQHLAGRAKLGEPPEHGGDRLTHRLIGADGGLAVLVILKACRESDPQLALGRLVPHPGDQPALEQVQLCL
jgi:hypothetical protein